MKQIDKEHLRALRNDIAIRDVVAALGIPTGRRSRRVTFRCPTCRRQDTALSEERNLGHCFRCHERFNTIDLVMAEEDCTFLEAVDLLSCLST